MKRKIFSETLRHEQTIKSRSVLIDKKKIKTFHQVDFVIPADFERK